MYQADNSPKVERVILAGVALRNGTRWEEEESLEELAQLAGTAGAEVVDKVFQQRATPDPATLIGKGKAKSLKAICGELGVDTVVFDQDLTPAQVRNLEEILDRKVVDRTEVILDIFAQHARTKTAKIEVELAQLHYRLPRLAGKGIDLSRLGGGIGTRGPGEQKLEVDRRRIRYRIRRLEKEIEGIEKAARVQKKGRESFFRVALVGYTNGGKSTLMNALASSSVFVDERLFATLDATTRIVELADHQKILLTDTVGFIRNLPHGLISSFHSTLEEAIEADLRLHVVDASHPNYEAQMDAAQQVLSDLGCSDKPILNVFNKIDKLPEDFPTERLTHKYPNSVVIAALTGRGLDELKASIQEFLESERVEGFLRLPLEKAGLLPQIYEWGEVLERREIDNSIELRVRMRREDLQRLTNLSTGSVASKEVDTDTTHQS